MFPRKLIAAVTLVSALAASAPAFADIVLNGRVYPERDRSDLMTSCAGLFAEAHRSAIAHVPDDEYNGDLASGYQLRGLPFDLDDCEDAGLV